MGGGNAHQRAVAKATTARIEIQVLQIAAQIFGARQLVSDQKTPWYETGRFWGGFGAFFTVVFTVLATMLKDIRWLLFLGLPFEALSWTVVCRPVTPSRWHWRRFLLFVLVALTGAGLWVVYRMLPRPTIPAALQPPNNPSGPPKLPVDTGHLTAECSLPRDYSPCENKVLCQESAQFCGCEFGRGF